MIFSKRKLYSTLLLVTILASGSKNDDFQVHGDAIPPFPTMFSSPPDQAPVYRWPLARIVTESISATGSSSSQEEYIDLGAGKYAYVMNDKREVVYISGSESLTLKYRPYTCDSYEKHAQLLPGVDDLSEIYGNFGTRFLGVTGIWLQAEKLRKSYTKLVTNDEITELDRIYHVWEHTHTSVHHIIQMYFTETFLLDRIEIRNANKEIVKTINVLSIEYEPDNYIMSSILSVPVGFDCSVHLREKHKTEEVGNRDDDDDEGDNSVDQFWSAYFWTESRVKLEVVGTRMSNHETHGSEEPSSSDTIYVELAHSFMEHSIKGPRSDLFMSKVKSKQQETRTILNHFYGVKYHIDSRTGVCSMSHLDYGSSAKTEEQQDLEDEASDDLVLKFDNGLELPFHKRTIKSWFTSETPAVRIKTKTRLDQDRSKSIDYIILERPSVQWPYSASSGEKLLARLMMTLVAPTGEQGESPMPKMESLTIWLLPPEQDRILETYHVSVIEEETLLELWPDVAGLFDVSEECYLNDPTKRAGLDYAWIDLFYPLPSRTLESLLDNELKLKQTIYHNVIDLGLVSSFSLPRFEVMFGDEGLSLRMLLLDLPPFELLFDSKKASKLYADPNGSGIQEFVLPDERHCARLCQLHDCLTMSFCKLSNECLMSHGPARFDEEATGSDDRYESLIAASPDCTTFGTRQPKLMKQLRLQRLSNIISVLQSQEFDNLDLPPMPEELSMSRDDSNLSDSEFNQMLADYISIVASYLKQQNNDERLPELTLSLMVGNQVIVLLPTKLTIENNPLEEFSLSCANSDSGENDLQLYDPRKIVEFFHTGLPGSYLDMTKVSGDHRKTFRRATGLSYDQCALTCLDSKCGIFSYCEQHKECVMSNLATVQEAKQADLLSADRECLVAQRDYTQHFQKYADIEAGEDILVVDRLAAEPVLTVNDCASSCVTETQFNCYSFEVCSNIGDTTKKETICYKHDQRRAGRLYHRVNNGDSSSGSTFKCDHYERSYLAEFNTIELHSIKLDILNTLKTSKYQGKTTFECADICLNELADCSAFQFCLEPNSMRNRVSNKLGQSCTMIESMLEDEAKREDAEYVIDGEHPELATTTLSNRNNSQHPDRGILQSDGHCHVFALRSNTIQAHLRSLAMGQTTTSQERDRLLRLQETTIAVGVISSWTGLFTLVLSLMIVSTLAGVGLIWARERNGLARAYMDRVQAELSRQLSRFTGQK